MAIFDPKEMSTAAFHGILLTAVSPRPIALASTIDEDGNVNLSPFSFFNAFSANPPIVIFSPARRVKDNTTKHTLENVLKVPEVVINIVNHAMVEQMSLSSTEYAAGVNEFEKAGFTEVKSDLIAPPRVKESPVSFECKVVEVKPMGTDGGAGNLVICEVIRAHVADQYLDENNKLKATELDLVARMGGSWYTKTNASTMFEIPKPLTSLGVGFDQLPDHVRNSTILTGNNLGRLANVEQLPSEESVSAFRSETAVDEIFNTYSESKDRVEQALHTLAQEQLKKGEVEIAWKVLLQKQ